MLLYHNRNKVFSLAPSELLRGKGVATSLTISWWGLLEPMAIGLCVAAIIEWSSKQFYSGIFFLGNANALNQRLSDTIVN